MKIRIGLSLFLMAFAVAAQAQTPQQKPSSPHSSGIPGITGDNPFPQGCVDCHVQRPDMDVRLSTILQQWQSSGVPPELLKKLKGFAGKHQLTGRHPPVEVAGTQVPDVCMSCHGKGGQVAPALGPLMHGIHLTGGEQNHYLTEFQGQCTYCHSFDAQTGTWSLSSGTAGK